jgi:hypothetical protein
MTSLKDQTEFPKVWDNTMLADTSDCEQKANIRFLHHLRPNTSNVNLHAGKVFAKGIDTVRRTFYGPPTPLDAKAEGAKEMIREWGEFDSGDSVKSLPNMLGALESYLVQYNPATDHIKPLIINGVPATEFSFAHPLEVLHPITNEPLIYCGRFDMLGVLNNEVLFVVDEKTTKQLGPTWPKQWTLRSQFMGYTWGARKFGHDVKGAIVRGVSILKKSYGHAEAIVYFDQWMLDRWYEQVHYKLERLKQSWKMGLYQHSFSLTCTAYGGCPYMMLCESPNPDQWVDPYYVVEKWDPMKLREVAE